MGAPGESRPSTRTPGGTSCWPPAPPPGKSLAFQLPAWPRCSARAGATAGPAPPFSTCPPPRRWPRTSSPRSRRSTCRGSRPARTTATAPASSGTGRGTTPSTSSPTPTCSTTRCCPGTHAGRASSPSCSYVVVDECHHYRGVFGAHVALVLRRLRRVCAPLRRVPDVRAGLRHGRRPGGLGRPADRPPRRGRSPRTPRRGARSRWACGSRRSRRTPGENGAPVRRAATAEVADLLADLVAGGVRTLAFVRSRKGAESVALTAGRLLDEVEPGLSRDGGGLPRRLPPRGPPRASRRPCATGDLLGVAATNALELGIDVAGLDAVLMAGFPGTRAAMWQQVGRAGRRGTDAVAVLVARDDPLDTYLVTHPEALVGAPVEATVFDPGNPHVLGPHLCCAAAELPLREAGPAVVRPVGRGRRRRRWHEAGLLRRTDGGVVLDRPDAGRRDLADLRPHRRPSPRPGRGRHRSRHRHGRRVVRRTARCTRARSTSTRARPTWCATSTSRTTSRCSSEPTPATPPRRARSPTSRCWRS